FPEVIPVLTADYLRVTHPSAGLRGPEGQLLPRLACVKPAASVRPEPGSNSPLYITPINCSSLKLGVYKKLSSSNPLKRGRQELDVRSSVCSSILKNENPNFRMAFV